MCISWEQKKSSCKNVSYHLVRLNVLWSHFDWEKTLRIVNHLCRDASLCSIIAMHCALWFISLHILLSRYLLTSEPYPINVTIFVKLKKKRWLYFGIAYSNQPNTFLHHVCICIVPLNIQNTNGFKSVSTTLLYSP